jgi:aryl-alcohol dehydrogenase-like predicted oxidoreductase
VNVVLPNTENSNGYAGRLILGAAQFGMPYGVTNRRGQVPESEVRAILARAQNSQLSLIDTAAAYGASEQVLGRILTDFPDLGIISKIPALSGDDIGVVDVERLATSVSRSLERLRRNRFNALLVHAGSDLFKPGGQRLVEFLQLARSNGTTLRIGVSIYEAKEIDGVLDMFTPDIVQMPVNLFDQRLIRSGHVTKLRTANVETHGRSAFLQGALLTDAINLPDYFRRFSDTFAAYSNFLIEHKVSKLTASLGFVMEQSGVDKVVVGVTSLREFEDILDALSRPFVLPRMDRLACGDVDLTDPRRWPLSQPAQVASNP